VFLRAITVVASGEDRSADSDRQFDLVPTLLLASLRSGHFIDEFLELTRVLEVPVDGRESHVRDPVEWPESIHDKGAEADARKLDAGLSRELILDIIDELLHLRCGDRPLRTRDLHTVEQLGAVEVLDGS